ncbi:hypothetical protein ACFFF5_16755 [Lederbergia wuyishanensis]|uniref:Oxalate:formate antiporter n=1 Tax=Lederbergia wuyishanensis TaxID=1347903 RepID=A0ABU0D9Y9_9BACI|nr:hypothetical protein [Lederbergia wuyishanensis]MCJ8008489.1 hypothetical protein [Lederbergia wuyishanensis]MDQ0345232.1 hypothetical protein [Lederbergia wuyishanensis]
MKKHVSDRELIYVHMNQTDHFVLSYGIEFTEFISGIPHPIQNALLIRHKLKDSHFNMHTMLEYVDQEMIEKLVQEDINSFGDFCWIDFKEEEHLNLLSGQEIAEILYLGHIKEHLRIPFYGKLKNYYAYLSNDDGWFNKTYYKNWDLFFTMLGSTIAIKMNNQKEKSLLFRVKKKNTPAIPKEILNPFSDLMKEGIVISIEKAVRTRLTIEVPVWVIGDFFDMDEMYEEYEGLGGRKADGKLVFDRKTGEWQAFAAYSS